MPDPDDDELIADVWCATAEYARHAPIPDSLRVHPRLIVFIDDQCRRLASELEAAKAKVIRLEEWQENALYAIKVSQTEEPDEPIGPTEFILKDRTR